MVVFVGPGVSTEISRIFPADSSKLTVKKLKKMNEDEVSMQFLGGGYHPSYVGSLVLGCLFQEFE